MFVDVYNVKAIESSIGIFKRKCTLFTVDLQIHEKIRFVYLNWFDSVIWFFFSKVEKTEFSNLRLTVKKPGTDWLEKKATTSKNSSDT